MKLSIYKKISVISFFLLSFFVLLFYGMMFFEIPNNLKPIFFVGVFFLVLGLVGEIRVGELRISLEELKILVIVSSSAVITFLLSVLANLGPVIGASVVGLAYTLFVSKFAKSIKHLAQPIYCGAFVGMGSPLIFTSLELVGLAGLLAGIVFILSEKIYEGVGGTLGTIGFVGSVIAKKLYQLFW